MPTRIFLRAFGQASGGSVRLVLAAGAIDVGGAVHGSQSRITFVVLHVPRVIGWHIGNSFLVAAIITVLVAFPQWRMRAAGPHRAMAVTREGNADRRGGKNVGEMKPEEGDEGCEG
jgi:hypothetical protein